MNKEPSYSQKAFASYKKNAPAYLALSFVFLLIGALVIFAGFFMPSIILVLIPFVVLPFLFAVQFSMTHVRSGAELKSGLLLGGYARYVSLRSPYLGVYRVIRNFFKAFIVFFASVFIVSSIYEVVSIGTGNGLSEEINRFVNDMSALIQSGGDLTNIYTTMKEEYSQVFTFVVVIEGIAYLLSSLMFIHGIFMASAGTYVRGIMLGGKAPNAVSNAIYSAGFRRIRKEYYREHFKALWFLIPIIAIGFIGGYTIGLFVTADPMVMVDLGFGGILLLGSFFIPYAFEVIGMINLDHAQDYSKASIDVAKQAFEQMKAQQAFNQAQMDEFDEQLKKAEDMMKDAEKRAEEGKSLDDDDNNDSLN